MTTAAGPRSTAGPVVAGIGLEILAGILWIVADAGYPRVQVVVVWSGLSFAAFAAGLLLLVGARYGPGLGLSRFKLGSWSLLWCILTFGLASTSWRDPQEGSVSAVDVAFVPPALAMVALGLTVWAVGYGVGAGRPLVELGRRAVGRLGRSRGPVVRSLATPWLLFAIGITARLATVATRGQFGYVGDASAAVSSASGYDQILTLLGLFTQFAVAAAAIQVFSERRREARWTLVVLVVLSVALSGISGEKQSFVTTILAVLIPLSVARLRLPRLPVLLAALAFLLVIIPFNQAYRPEVRPGGASLTPAQAVAAAPEVLTGAISLDSLTQAIPDSVDYLTTRMRNIDSMAIILQRSPDSVPYLSPWELVAAPVIGIIPRAVWPGKPIMATGYEFGLAYYGQSASSYSSVAVSPPGDLYRHGGVAVLLTGMFLLGIGVRFIDDTFDARGNPHAVFFVLLLFPPLVKYEQDYLTLVASLPTTFIAAICGVLITFQVRPGHRPSGRPITSAVRSVDE